MRPPLFDFVRDDVLGATERKRAACLLWIAVGETEQLLFRALISRPVGRSVFAPQAGRRMPNTRRSSKAGSASRLNADRSFV